MTNSLTYIHIYTNFSLTYVHIYTLKLKTLATMMSSRIWSSSSSACCCNIKWAVCKFCIILQKPVLKQDKWLALILLQTRAFAVNKQVILVTHKDHVPGLYIPLRHCARWGNQQLPRHPAVYSQNEKRQVRGIVEHVRLTMQERYSRSAVDCSIKRVPNAILGQMEGQTSQWEKTSHLHLRHERGATKIDRWAYSIH